MQKIKIFKDTNQNRLEKTINDFIADKHVISVSLTIYPFMFEQHGVAILYDDDNSPS